VETFDQTPLDVGGINQWHHLAWVYDATKTGASRTTLYLDG
jgi:hypothetical protein